MKIYEWLLNNLSLIRSDYSPTTLVNEGGVGKVYFLGVFSDRLEKPRECVVELVLRPSV